MQETSNSTRDVSGSLRERTVEQRIAGRLLSTPKTGSGLYKEMGTNLG